MPQTVIEKITQAHAVDLPAGHEVRTGDYVTLVPDHVMTHDNTAAVMLKYEGLGVEHFADPGQPVFTLDHNIQDTGEKNLAKYHPTSSLLRAGPLGQCPTPGKGKADIAPPTPPDLLRRPCNRWR